MKKILFSAALLVAATAYAQQKADPKPAGGGAGAPAAKPAEPAKPATPAQVAPAQPPAMTPPKPAPELDGIKWMAGTWKCDGMAAVTPMNPKEHKVQTKVVAKRDLDNFWYSIKVEEKKTKDHPMPWKGQIYWTFDPGTKKFAGAMVGNMGGWGTGSSAGWVGDKMEWAWDMYMPGMGKAQGKETLTKKSEKEMTQEFSMNMGKGGWVSMGVNTCKK
jgi:hypothetical protein